MNTKALRVAVLTNQVMPYFAHTFEAIATRVGHLRIMPSVILEPDRPWQPQWRALDVQVQKTITLSGLHKHPKFDARKHIHVSYDVLPNLLRFKPDVVISHELGFRTLQALIWRWMPTWRGHRRLYAWVRESTHMAVGRGRLRSILRSLILANVDGVFVNGNDGRDYVRTFSVPEDRIFIWPSVVPVEPFLGQPEQRPPEISRRLLYIGQLIQRKGLLPFIDVLARWARDNPDRQISMLVVGDGPQHQALVSLATPANLALEFTGSIDYDGVAQTYSAAGVLAFPTLGDEWGMVVNEALASAMPVLGSVFSHAVLDLVEEGVTGWRFSSDNAESTYEALNRLFATSDELLADMRRNCRNRGRALTPSFAASEVLGAIATPATSQSAKVGLAKTEPT